MKKIISFILAVIFFLPVVSWGQVNWNFGTTSGNASPSTNTYSNLTVSDLTQGNNNGTTNLLTTTSASSGYTGASGQYNAGAAVRTGALNTGAGGSTYFEFTLTPGNSYTVKLTAISFGARSTSTGPQAYTLRYSIDSYASDLATGLLTNNSTWELKTNTLLNIVGSVSTSITFRIYGYNGTGSAVANTANWRMDDLSLVLDESLLPVELTSFTASNTDNGVQLKWETATEVNNYGFNVERAVGNRQGTSASSSASSEHRLSASWETLGFVQGHGNSNSPKSYSFTDAAVTTGKVQYRLKQIDFDGKFEYSNIVEVNVEAPAKLVLYQNSPNPFNPTTEIKFALPKLSNVELSIYNMLGEKIQTLANGMMNAGEHKVAFNASNLSSGVYLYKLTTDNVTSVRKMILMK